MVESISLLIHTHVKPFSMPITPVPHTQTQIHKKKIVLKRNSLYNSSATNNVKLFPHRSPSVYGGGGGVDPERCTEPEPCLFRQTLYL